MSIQSAGGEGAARGFDLVGEGLTLHELHHDERLSLVFTEIEDRDDVGVVRCRRIGPRSIDRESLSTLRT